MRKLLVDIALWDWDTNSLDDIEQANKCHEFYFDFARRYLKTSKAELNGISPFTNRDCTYHEHGAEGKACYKTMFDGCKRSLSGQHVILEDESLLRGGLFTVTASETVLIFAAGQANSLLKLH